MAKKNKADFKVVQKIDEEVPAEVLATAIVDIGNAMNKIVHSRLKRETIITLIHARSKVARRDIELVLNNLEELERNWLKPQF